MRIGSLFSGAGGLDMAVEHVFGGEVVWQSEVDPAASKVLAHRFPCAPNLGDITKANWNAADRVDIICGGFPCQDVSLAGKRAGIHGGSRSGLWAEMARMLLPSPVAQQSGSSPEEHLRRKPGRTQVTDLAIIVEHGLM